MKTLKKLFFTLILSHLIASAWSQNLVPNPGFDTLINCPMTIGAGCQWGYFDVVSNSTTYWRGLSCGSPDYYNSCSPTFNQVSVPVNYQGYQMAKTGTGYVGAGISGNSNEYFGTYLTSPLVAGVKYFVSFYASFSNISIVGSSGTDAIGVLFTIGIPDTTGSPYFLNYPPQVKRPNGYLVYDTLNWTQISGSFIAAGGEDFLTIGNFTNQNLMGSDYYYYDDVSVIVDTSTGYQKNNSDLSIEVLPNPFSNYIQIILPENQQLEFLLFDITMRNLAMKKVVDSHALNTEDVKNGIYFYQIRNKNRLLKTGKLCKIN